MKALNVHNIGEIENAVASFASGANGGLIVIASVIAMRSRTLIVGLAARHRLPAVHYGRHYVMAGGLLSYGPNWPDQYQHAAGYVDRILKGEKPAVGEPKIGRCGR